MLVVDIGARVDREGAIVLVVAEEAAAGESAAGRAMVADDPAINGAVDLVYMFVLSVIVFNLSFLSFEILASVLIGSTVVCACLVLVEVDIGADGTLITPWLSRIKYS